MRRILALSLLVLAAARPAHAAWPSSPTTNLPVCTWAGTQHDARVVTDGNGGAIVAWRDQRSDTGDIYAQHLLASGIVDPAWPVGGRAITVATGNQLLPLLVSDGAGGAIITWEDMRNGPSDIYAQRVLASGAVDAAWPVNGRAVCSAASDQGQQQIVTDGAGGAIITWVDYRGVNTDIYAARVTSAGVVDAAWGVNGRAVCTQAAGQTQPQLIADGAGGVFICWQDGRSGTETDIYAEHVLATGERDGARPYAEQAVCTAVDYQSGPQMISDGAGGFIAAWTDERDGSMAGNSSVYVVRMLANGTVASGWPTNGRAVCNVAGKQGSPSIAPDGDGGIFVTWTDMRSGGVSPRNIYAQHLDAAGSVEAGWTAEGLAVCTAISDQDNPRIVIDGTGGFIAAWDDARTTSLDIYAQRIGPFGRLGSPEPHIAGVHDVPWDQGGHVKVTWDASTLDTQRDGEFTGYDILRASPGKAGGAVAILGDDLAALRTGDLVAVPRSGATTYWEYMTSVPALHFVANYAYVSPTTSDSMAVANPLTSFMVVGRNATGSMYWPSAVVSGYSVDNLAPLAPGALAGNCAAGVAHLTWFANAEPDLAGYRVYRGATSSFTPGPASLVASTALTRCDVSGDYGWFKLTAIDAHGNESPVATLAPAATSPVDGPRPVFMFAAPAPNPASGGTMFSFSLAQSGSVSLAVHDLAGRRVRTILNGELAVGAHSERWDLRDDAGHRVGAGMYVARLVTADGVRTQRMVVVP